mmetsp:Transcript_39449/g.113372  ORF Transcript_39449/g.113372 Transcript_39449/m.113372 type:complete len:257 (+) Transcript_39449:92-862(+)
MWLSGVTDWVTKAELLDALPVAAQGKSMLQVLSGDSAGALRTQENFSRRCVGISQLRQVVERQSGDAAAAAQTQQEFAATLQKADEAVGGALRGVASATGQVRERILESELAASFAHNVQGAVERGADAAERAARHIADLELSKQFAELLERNAPGWLNEGWRPSDGAGRASREAPPSGQPTGDVDSHTLLAEITPSQVGTQCPCCLENFAAGERVRVLPCFHSMHKHCGDSWLYAHPVCPVCRLDIRASLELHRR